MLYEVITVHTPLFAEGVNIFSVLWGNLFAKNERLVPERPLHTVKTELKSLNKNRDLLIWLGHSSWYVQLGGKRLLIDPVFSVYAAPFSFMNKVV